MKTYIIYHKDCPDGMASAWVASRKFNDALFYHLNRGDVLPRSFFNELTCKDAVYFIDYSESREVLDEIRSRCGKLVILDHHKSAQETLQDYPGAIFDMKECGATLAWKYFFPDVPLPNILKYVRDRDLWLWQQPNAKEIVTYIDSCPMTFQTYEGLFHAFENMACLDSIIAEGRAMCGFRDVQVEQACKNVFWIDLCGHRIPIVNTPLFEDDVCARLYTLYPDAPFSAYFFQRDHDTYQYGLRSNRDGSNFDVSSIAKTFPGGGGHRNAAGFTLSYKL